MDLKESILAAVQGLTEQRRLCVAKLLNMNEDYVHYDKAVMKLQATINDIDARIDVLLSD